MRTWHNESGCGYSKATLRRWGESQEEKILAKERKMRDIKRKQKQRNKKKRNSK